MALTNTGMAQAYRGNRLKGDDCPAANARKHFDVIGHMGGLVAMHSKAPPPVAEYDAWLAALPNRRGGRITGAKLRRAVIMRRQGASLEECGLAIGFRVPGIHKWLRRLPPELGV